MTDATKKSEVLARIRETPYHSNHDRCVEITLKGLRLDRGRNSRGNSFLARQRHRHEKELVLTSLAGFDPPELPVRVVITRGSPGNPDDDNVSSSCKFVRDAIATWLNVDDGDTKSVQWSYQKERGEWMVRFTIESIASPKKPTAK